MNAIRLLAPVAALAALAGCGGETKTETERKTAAGEVLGGTVSDAMLPLDTVRSQSPPLQQAAKSGEGAPETASPGPSTRPSPRAESAPEPAATPSPSETPETDE